MITQEHAMRQARIYADEALHFRNIGSPMLMRTKGLGLMACEAATLSLTVGPTSALDKIDRRVGGVDERDIWRTRGAV